MKADLDMPTVRIACHRVMQSKPNQPELSIVIPAFNEAGKIQRDIRNAHAFLVDSLGDPGEIIVVDDGSSDDTASRARSLTGEVPELSVISYPRNKGKGHALRNGMSRTRGRYVMFADAGSCVPYEDALRGLELCREGVDLAHGSRRRDESRIVTHQPVHRRLGGRLFRLFARSLMGLPRDLMDSQCGFKVYRGDPARNLYGRIRSDGFMFDLEIIRRALREGLRIAEFPVRWSHDRDTRFRPLCGTIANLRELISMRLRT